MVNKKLSACFSYFGAKHGLCRKYPPPEHDLIIEPFAGSAGYSHLHYTKQVQLIDTDPNIISVWHYLLRVDVDSFMNLPLLNQIPDLSKLDDGPRQLIGFWLHRAGPAPKTEIAGWCKNPEYADRFWGEHVRSSIANNLPHIQKSWSFHSGDYLTQSPKTEATWFIDPPYKTAGSAYRQKFSRYDELGEWARTRKGLVIVCEQAGVSWGGLTFQFLSEGQATRKISATKPKSQEGVCILRDGVDITTDWLDTNNRV